MFSFAFKNLKGATGASGNCIWTATADPTTPNYTFAKSSLSGPSGFTPKVGDIVVRGYYRYTISSVASTTVLTDNRTSIRGATGATGPQGPAGPNLVYRTKSITVTKTTHNVGLTSGDTITVDAVDGYQPIFAMGKCSTWEIGCIVQSVIPSTRALSYLLLSVYPYGSTQSKTITIDFIIYYQSTI